MNKVEKTIEFVSFCIENYRAKHHLEGDVVAVLFDQKGVLDFLFEHSEMLHTQSRQYLMEEIERILHLEDTDE